ncbi:hypothetical protein ABZ635_17520 [Nocardiopsis sp. NPDC007018]|uniref:hypothetical protein n=1 Tax=Nocardiopsis sp. NPDC007018 TaxID=3155721 RepID=UPI0033C58D44
MDKGRWVVVVTCAVVAVLCAALVLLQWEQANRLATSASALAGLAAVGVAVWAALRPGQARTTGGVTVRDSGTARADGGGRATSGVRLPGRRESRDLRVRGSGDAIASGDGEAVSGIDQRGPAEDEPRT